MDNSNFTDSKFWGYFEIFRKYFEILRELFGKYLELFLEIFKAFFKYFPKEIYLQFSPNWGIFVIRPGCSKMC